MYIIYHYSKRLFIRSLRGHGLVKPSGPTFSSLTLVTLTSLKTTKEISLGSDKDMLE